MIFCDVCLLRRCRTILDTLRSKMCTYMCRKWVRFDETVTIISHRLAAFCRAVKNETTVTYYYIRYNPTDRILFYTFRVFSRNRHEFLTAVNAPGRSYCCVHILLLYTHYRCPFWCTKESILWASFILLYTRTNVHTPFILFSWNLSSDNIRVFNWIRSYNILCYNLFWRKKKTIALFLVYTLILQTFYEKIKSFRFPIRYNIYIPPPHRHEKYILL